MHKLPVEGGAFYAQAVLVTVRRLMGPEEYGGRCKIVVLGSASFKELLESFAGDGNHILESLVD